MTQPTPTAPTSGEALNKRAKGWQQCPDCNRLHAELSENSALVQAHRAFTGQVQVPSGIPTWRERSAGQELNGMTTFNAMKAEIADLRAERAEWHKLKDPVALHHNLLRGFPARLTPEMLRHIAGDYSDAAMAAGGVQADGDALYAAWHKVGADVAGLKFADFVAALAAVGAPQGQAEPVAGDFVIVPREPTEAMLDAAYAASEAGCFFAGIYKDMLAAAPTQPTKAEPVAWASVDDELPEFGARVLVTRFAGRVANPTHPGHPGVPWIEVTRYLPNGSMFECDIVSTGYVTHWMPLPAAPTQPTQAEQEGM